MNGRRGGDYNLSALLAAAVNGVAGFYRIARLLEFMYIFFEIRRKHLLAVKAFTLGASLLTSVAVILQHQSALAAVDLRLESKEIRQSKRASGV